MGLPSNWDSLLYMAVSSCCSKCAHNQHTHIHFLICTSTPTNMLNIDGHWWSQHTGAVLGESRGFQLSVLCMNTSRFLRFPLQQQQQQQQQGRGLNPLTASNRIVNTNLCSGSDMTTSNTKTERHKTKTTEDESKNRPPACPSSGVTVATSHMVTLGNRCNWSRCQWGARWCWGGGAVEEQQTEVKEVEWGWRNMFYCSRVEASAQRNMRGEINLPQWKLFITIWVVCLKLNWIQPQVHLSAGNWRERREIHSFLQRFLLNINIRYFLSQHK